MNEEQAIKKFNKILSRYEEECDHEHLHREADRILYKFVKAHYPDIAAKYKECEEMIFFYI